MKAFKDVLRELRISNNLTQDQLAKNLNLGRSRISMYERGEREPDIETLELISDYFNVDMNFLLGKTNMTTTVGYYVNDETRKIAQEIYDNKELTLLFDAAKDASPDDIKTVHTMLLALKNKEKQ